MPAITLVAPAPTRELAADAYRAIFESSSDCVKILSLDGTIQSMNACSRLLLIDEHAAVVGGSSWSALWHASDHPELERALESARNGQAGQFSGWRSSGVTEPRWWDAWVRPLLGQDGQVHALVAVSRDGTEAYESALLSRQTAEALAVAAQANAKLRTFFEQGANFAVLMQSDGAVLEVNRAAIALAGFPAEDIVGRSFWECGWWNRSAEVSDTVRAGLTRAARGGMFREELRYFVVDGSERVVDLTLAPVLDEAGLVLFVAATGTDITERKLAAETLRQISADFSEADRRKTEFLVTLAHELRNPLAPISNGLDVMRLGGDKPDLVARTRSMIERQVGQLSHLVDDLLDIARITSGKLDLKKIGVDLNQILSVAVETSAPLMQAGGQTFVFAIGDGPLPVLVDPTRIIQVTSNLLNNASKYTPRGGTITMSAAREGDEAVVTILDDGIGIASSQIENVFTMFSQVGQSIERSQGGLGIGLSLARQLLGMHGGTVRAASAGLDKGSEFTIRLPLDLSRHNSGVALPSAATSGTTLSLRVVVADDNTDAADAMADVMGMLGHDCGVAYDGLQAVERACTTNAQVVFLDIGMPRLNGYEAAAAIRRLPELEGVVLIALTGWGGADERTKSSAAGFNHHITKPASIETLESLLATVAGDLQLQHWATDIARQAPTAAMTLIPVRPWPGRQ